MELLDSLYPETMKKLLLLSLLIINPVYGYYTTDIPNKCGLIPEMFTVFTPYQYTCQAGEFLPAYTLGCKTCPDGYICNGGTYDFNNDIFQGAIKSGYINNNLTNLCSTNAPHELFAVMIPNEHNCVPGYYLPANTDGCQPCPQNNKCVGGTYTFNETLPQGIKQCENGYFAPNGSAVCYPHILHIDNNNLYLKSEKATTPSLNVKISNDIFYANMTTIPTTINNTTEQYLKIKQGDTVYYVCDDTICP